MQGNSQKPHLLGNGAFGYIYPLIQDDSMLTVVHSHSKMLSYFKAETTRTTLPLTPPADKKS